VEGVSRVTSIVQAMKRFAHPSSGDMAPADLNEALRTTLTVCRSEYKQVAEVELELEELPLVVCNVGDLNQVFLNLIVNAAQAMGEAAEETGTLGRISIASRLDGDHVVIDFADDGPGIPTELLERIYEPFFTTKEVGTGSGQGLAIARATVEQHGGSLGCRSVPGQGAAFSIRLPVDCSASTPKAA
jgi:two-component system NtrC family sensor kinase